ncbi:TetR family transcriptional regulator, partial [Nocardia carnea]
MWGGGGGRARRAAAAGLSNDAFYRHFRSKDALMAAVLA